MSEENDRRELDDDLKVILDEIRLSEEGERFMKSKLGEYILDCALREEEVARAQWKLVDPCNAEKIRELQYQARVPNLLFCWVNEAIRKGNEAMMQLEQESNNA